jgi:hypothetical protein
MPTSCDSTSVMFNTLRCKANIDKIRFEESRPYRKDGVLLITRLYFNTFVWVTQWSGGWQSGQEPEKGEERITFRANMITLTCQRS